MIWRPSPQWAGKSVVSGATTTRMGWNVLRYPILLSSPLPSHLHIPLPFSHSIHKQKINYFSSDGVMFAWGNGNLGTGEDSQSAATPMRLWDLDGHRIVCILVYFIYHYCYIILSSILYFSFTLSSCACWSNR